MARFMGLTPEGFLPPVAREDVLTEVFAGVDTQIDARTTKPRTTAINVTAPPYNADPTGLTDATQAIQNAVNAAAAAGKGAVYIPAGSYRVSPPFIEMKPEVLIHGDGDSTVIFVDASAPAPVEKIGVFHIGTYNNRAQDPKMYRSSLRDLMIKTVDGSQAHQPAIENVCGVILNTDLGSSTHDPDAVHSLRGLTIWDMHIGMAILGGDDQGMKISDIRIRGGNEMGLLVGKPSDHPEVIAGVSGGPGAADNKFLNMDVSSSNKLGGIHAGIEIYTSNSKFVNSTSWYNRRFGSFAGTQGTDRSTYYDGAGWYVKGTKNVFVSCTAQENGGHGFITQYPGCQFIGCIAESNSWHDSVKGDALVNEASGFFVCNGASDTQIISARSNNARGADKGQAYGYVLENYAKNQWVQGTADQNFSGAVKFGTNMASLGKDVVVRVGDTTLNWAERCVDGVVLEGSNLVLSFTDGTSESVDLSALKGAAGGNETPGSGITPTPAPNTEARRAVILGDSHSDTAWPQADGVWWWQTAADLSGVTVLDVYAVGGMTTRDALNGWDDREGGLTTPQIVQAEASSADLAIMEFGGNDVSNGIDATEYRANLTEITQRLMASGKRVLIMAPPPLFAGAEERIVAQYAEYRRIDEEVAAACSAYYVDAWDAIGTGPGGSLPSSYDSGDHIHMNSYGQMALGKAIAPSLQQVAGVVDPYDGVRDIRWFGWETVQGDKNLVLGEPGPQDALFKGAETAVATTPAEDTNAAVTIYSFFNSAPGAVWEVSYAYRIESSTGRANITPSLAIWPGGFVTEYPQRDRLVGLEGVRRYQVTIPEEATDGEMFFLNLPAVAGKLTARIGMLGMRLIKESPLILEPTPEPEPEPVVPTEPEPEP